MDPRIKELREILEQPIDWYNKNKSNPGLVYDELYCQFSSLGRGDFVRLIETVLADDD